MKRILAELCLAVIFVPACGGDDDGGDDSADGDFSDIDGGGGDVSGVVHVIQGASAASALWAQSPGPAPLLPLIDGNYWVSPDRVRVTIDRIGFNASDPSGGTGAELTDCEIEYDRTDSSLSPLLDCPFELGLPGGQGFDAVAISLQMKGMTEILISDPVNGLFTDADAPGGLSTVEPAGGADFVPWTSSLGTSSGAAFTTPLEIGPGTELSPAIVLDAVQTVEVQVSGGEPSFNPTSVWFPVVVFPTLGAPGRASFYSSAGTADTIHVESNVPLTNGRLYYDGDDEPAYAFVPGACGVALDSPKAAYATDPDDGPVLNDGSRIGGWLARDDGGTICWVLPEDSMYTTYAAYLSMPEVDTIGETTTLSCEATTTPTPPSSGTTYAGGCPTITADETYTLTLAAD